MYCMAKNTWSMDNENWKLRENIVLEYIESNDIGDMKPVIEWNLNQGRNDVENRKRFWGNIRNLLAMLPNSPITPDVAFDLDEDADEAYADEEDDGKYSECCGAEIKTCEGSSCESCSECEFVKCSCCDNDDYCFECSHRCESCDEYSCPNCTASCEECFGEFCERCTRSCPDCQAVFCKEHFTYPCHIRY